MMSSLVLAGCESSSGGLPGFGDVAPAAPAAATSPGSSPQIDAQFQSIAAVADTSNSSTYQIGPADVLGISVFQVPELNMDTQVAANGTITLPLIGIVKVTGKEAQQVGEEIATKLRAKYLQSPQVTVYVRQYNSQKIIVSGNVTSPGTIAMTGDTTLLSALADAKGLSELADPKHVFVFRRVEGRKYAARFDLDAIQAGKAPDPHLVKGDLVYVDTNEVKSWVKTLLPLVAVAGLFALI